MNRLNSIKVKNQDRYVAEKKFTFKQKAKITWEEIKKNRVYYGMLTPYYLCFFVFIILPVILSIYYSFTYYNMLEKPEFIGFKNYVNLFLDDDVFLVAFKNTLILAVITGPVGYMMAFVFAWLINELPKALRTFMTLVFYAPSLSGAAYTIWLLIFSGDAYGWINAYFMKWGLIKEPQLWLRNPNHAILILVIVQLWMSLGVGFLSFIAGLQNADKTLYEAASVDGIKNRWQELWYITLPQMKPQLMFGAVMQITGSFGIGFLSKMLLGFPSTDYSGHTIINHLEDYGMIRYELGYASAIATILFLFMIFLNKIIQKLLRNVGT